MYTIKHHLSKFIGELKKNSPLRVTLEGGFYVESGIKKMIRIFFGLDRNRLIDACEVYARLLDEIESVPVLFANDETTEYLQEMDFTLCLEAGDLLIQKLNCYHDRQLFSLRSKLERALIALRYRLERTNGGLDAGSFDQESFSSLIHAAGIWKSAQQIYPDKRLSVEELKQLAEASRYSLFAKVVLQDPDIASNFFQWALRDRIAVRPFIEYPHHQYKINRSLLNGRLGRFGGNGLKIQKELHEGLYEKHLTIPIEGRQVSILDEMKPVIFKGDLALTIAGIFSIFENKKVESGCLEYMAEGITNWSTHHWGFWNAKDNRYERIDFSKEEWWTQLPVVDHLTLAQARKKFGRHLTGVEWNFALVSARVSQDLDFENSHAYTSIAVPLADGSYVVYSMGKCTFTFPESPLKALFNIGETSEATIAYPDENIFYTHRRKTRFSYAMSPKEGRRFFESVKRDMQLSYEGNLVYQIESENCAKWAYEKLLDAVGRHRVPEIYTMPFLKSEPNGLLKTVFSFLHSLPVKWQIPVTTFIHLILGGYKGRLIIENQKAVWKSLTFHPFWKDTVIFHPSMLYKQQEEGNLFRFVPAGVTLVGRAVLSLVVVEGCFLLNYFNSLKLKIYKKTTREKMAISSPLNPLFQDLQLMRVSAL